MGHNGVVSDHPKSTRIPRLDGLSTDPRIWGVTIVSDRVKREEDNWPRFDSRNRGKVKMIRERLKVAMDRQKSYANMRRKYIRYEIDEKVFLKVSPLKKVMRFGKNGNLSPRFIRSSEVIEKAGPVAYRLALPPELEKIPNVFHV